MKKLLILGAVLTTLTSCGVVRTAGSVAVGAGQVALGAADVIL